MRLREEQMRRELLAGREGLLAGDRWPRLSRALRERFSDYRQAFIVDWIPEQAEEICTVLIDGATIAIVEVSRLESQPTLFQSMTLAEYRRKQQGMMSRTSRRRLEMALALTEAAVDELR